MTVTELNHQTQKLTKALQDLPAAYDQLALFKLPGSRPSDTGSKQKHGALSTKALLMLDVVDLLDGKHKVDAEPTREPHEIAYDRKVWVWEDGKGRKVTESGQRRLGVLPTLSQWVRLTDGALWDTGHDHAAPADTPTVDSECSWLLDHTDWILTQPWAGDLVDDLHHMLTDVQRIIGIEAQARYYCTRCGWPVAERDQGAWYSCTGCDTNWTRLELHRMAERKKPKKLGDIATITGISLKTLRAYADRGHLKVVAREGKASLYDLDAVALATMNLKYKRSGLRVA